MRFSCILFMVYSLFAAHAEAKSDILKEEKRVFGGTSCIPKPTCLEEPAIPMLKEYGFWVRALRILPSPKQSDEQEMFYSSLYAWYETADPKDVEEFAFVQYVRGCIYSSERHASGVVTTHFSVTHQNLGERTIFLHPDWVVDSVFSDPMLMGDPKYPIRHYFLESQKRPDQFPSEHGTYYGDNPPQRPRLSIFVGPSPSAHVPSRSEDFATNHALEYRTCLYRTKDIPTESDGSMIAGALGCFAWSSSYVYDHKTKQYTFPAGENSVCRPEKLPNLKNGW